MRKQIRDILIGEKYTDSQGQEKTAWTKIGVMFIQIDDNGNLGNISMLLKAYPAKGENPIAFPPKPRKTEQSNYSQPSQEPSIPTVDINEDIEGLKVEDVPF